MFAAAAHVDANDDLGLERHVTGQLAGKDEKAKVGVADTHAVRADQKRNHRFITKIRRFYCFALASGLTFGVRFVLPAVVFAEHILKVGRRFHLSYRAMIIADVVVISLFYVFIEWDISRNRSFLAQWARRCEYELLSADFLAVVRRNVSS